MKTPDEIKKGLYVCYVRPEGRKCDECPYFYDDERYCDCNPGTDALAYIQQLESDLAEAQRDIDMLGEQATALDGAHDAMKRERDAAVADILRECHKCKHFKVLFNGCTPDYDCDLSDVCRDNDHWQWRGVQNDG